MLAETVLLLVGHRFSYGFAFFPPPKPPTSITNPALAASAPAEDGKHGGSPSRGSVAHLEALGSRPSQGSRCLAFEGATTEGDCAAKY